MSRSDIRRIEQLEDRLRRLMGQTMGYDKGDTLEYREYMPSLDHRINKLSKRIDEIIEYLDVEYSEPQPSKLVPKSKRKK